MPPPSKYRPTCWRDCIRCIYAPVMDSIDDGIYKYPKCCNKTCCCGCCLCLAFCGCLSTCFYAMDPLACATCTCMSDDRLIELAPEEYSETKKDKKEREKKNQQRNRY